MSQSSVTQSINDPLPAFQTYQRQFVDYLRDPLKNDSFPEILPPGISVYARLLHNKIDGSLRACFPITRELLGAVHWRQLVQSFIKDHRCQSPLYREIPDEFIDYLMHETRLEVLPGFIVDLTHYEWMELVLETAKPAVSDKIFPAQGSLLKAVPALNPVLHVLHYRYPVQSIMPSDRHWRNWENRLKPYDQETIILAGFRDRDYRIHFIQLNAVTARLIELLKTARLTGEQALRQLAAEMRYTDPETILPFGIDILRQLEAQQIIIGALND